MSVRERVVFALIELLGTRLWRRTLALATIATTTPTGAVDRSDKAPESGRRTKRQRNESHSLSQHDSSLDLHWLTCKTARQTSFGRTSSRLRTCHRSGCRSQLTSCQKERSSESHYCCWRRTGRCCTSSRRWSRWCTAKGKERTTNDWRARGATANT